MTALEAEQRRSRRFGWSWLLLWATAGAALETAHGFKLGLYLDDEVARTMLRLGHAHGVGLSIVALLHGALGAPLFADRADGGRACGRLIRAAALLVPLGFALSALGHPESDPGIAIFLVPPGAACLLAALGWTALRAWRAP
jgi:hypothetical protein